MSRKLKKCWICDKCGKARVDEFTSPVYKKVLPSGWIFLDVGILSNACLCGECARELAAERKASGQ